MMTFDPESKRVAAYAEDAVFVMAGAPPLHGRDAMRRRTKTRLFSPTLIPHSTIANGRLACVYGLFTCFVDRTEAWEGRQVALRFLIVWRKEPDGAWRIAREFLNPDVPE